MRRIQELERALSDLIDEAEGLDFSVDQEYGVGATAPNEVIQRAKKVLESPGELPNSYVTFLDRIIDDGFGAAKHSYDNDDVKLRGAVAGFEACRGLSPVLLGRLLEKAHQSFLDLRPFGDNPDLEPEYWWRRCFELEVEWVCNVMSAWLMHQGLPTIVPPTARGALKAAEVVGVAAF